MTKIIEGDLILEEDYSIDDSLIVKGNIYGKDGKIWNLDCLNLDCLNLDCRNLNCRNLDCLNLDCWDLDCLNLDCLNLDCRNLSCWNLNCRNLNCLNLNCRNLDCWDLSCRNLNCWDITYYAVCFAYKNIKCKSIKGRRDNCKYFVLDGTIEIDGKIQESGK